MKIPFPLMAEKNSLCEDANTLFKILRKRSFIIVFSLLIQTVCSAQSPGDNYVFKADYAGLQEIDPFTNLVVPPAVATINMARRGDIFTIGGPVTVGAVAGYSIIFWRFSSAIADITVAGTVHHSIDISNNGKTFFIPTSVITSNTTNQFNQRHGWLKLDAVVLPIKIRFHNQQPGGEFDFLQSVSIGPAISFNTTYGGPFGNLSTSILTGFNITNVSVDETTAPGSVTSKTTLMGLSPFIGYNVSYKGINFGVLGGFDILTGKAERTFSYRKSPWLGISIGGSILNAGTNQKN